jgi:hypothetical protein
MSSSRKSVTKEPHLELPASFQSAHLTRVLRIFLLGSLGYHLEAQKMQVGCSPFEVQDVKMTSSIANTKSNFLALDRSKHSLAGKFWPRVGIKCGE